MLEHRPRLKPIVHLTRLLTKQMWKQGNLPLSLSRPKLTTLVGSSSSVRYIALALETEFESCNLKVIMSLQTQFNNFWRAL